MKITKGDLQRAVEESILTTEQLDQLWGFLDGVTAPRSRFDVPHVAFYTGALIVLAAMTLFMSSIWDRLGGSGIFFTSLIYAITLAVAGAYLWKRTLLHAPGGLLITVAVVMVPIAFYGIGMHFEFWNFYGFDIYQNIVSWLQGTPFLIAVSLFLASIVALLFVRFLYSCQRSSSFG